MVSLSLLKLLENNGLGTIDENLFWEKMGIDRDGLYISTISHRFGSTERPSVTYSIYSRSENDVQAFQQLQAVVDFLNDSLDICELPSVPPVTDYGYDNVAILPPTGVESVGQDRNGRMIFKISGQVYYGKQIKVTPPIPPTEGLSILLETGPSLLTQDNKKIITEMI